MKTIQDLHAWYLARIKDKRKGVRKIASSINTFLVIQLVYLFFPVYLAISASSEGYGTAGESLTILFAPMIIPAIVLTIMAMSKSELPEKVTQTIRSCKPVDRNEFPDLYACCDGLVVKMALKGIDYRILLVKNNSVFPFMIEQLGTHYVVCPRNFFKLFVNQIDQARAILCHEFAHVLQRDIEDHLLNQVLIPKLGKLAVVMLGITVIISIVMGTLGIPLLVINVLSWGFIFLSVGRSSEELADISVLLYDDGRNLVKLLDTHGSIEDSSIWHDKPSQRIARLTKTIEEYGLYPLQQSEVYQASFETSVQKLYEAIGEMVTADLKAQKVNILLREIIKSKSDAVQFLSMYRHRYNADFVKQVNDISSRYAPIKYALSLLIELCILEARYPHELCSKHKS